MRFPDLALLSAERSAPQPTEEAATATPMPTYDEAARSYIRRVLTATHGRIAGPRGAARLAGLHPSTFRSKMKKLGIALPGSDVPVPAGSA